MECTKLECWWLSSKKLAKIVLSMLALLAAAKYSCISHCCCSAVSSVLNDLNGLCVPCSEFALP